LGIPLAALSAIGLVQATSTPADQQLFQARVLAYSVATWTSHASALQVFYDFCENRVQNVLQATPYELNLFLLHIAQQGKSFGSIQRFLNAISFVYRFFSVPDIVQDSSVYDVKRFLAKVCPHIANKKLPFGSAEVRALWDKINDTGGLSSLSLLELRTFVMTVLQHATFCRYSDVKEIRLADILFELDYFKITIRYSKTDQEGVGQYVYVSKSAGVYDAHMLLCLYLTVVPENDADPTRCYLFPPLR
jgi:site-specific recombinase XerD